MQAILLISLFSLVITIISGIITSGTSNTGQLNQKRTDEIHTFFEQIAKVTLNDITLNQLRANPNNSNNPADFIRNISQLRNLSSGRYADAGLDPWGQPIKGAIVTEYQALAADSDNNVIVPITGIVMVSGGPDRIIQTPLPVINTLSGIYGVMVPTTAGGSKANDDIVYSFDNRTVQQQGLDMLKSRMEHIGSAALKELQMRISTYRQAKLQQYQADISAGKDVSLINLDVYADPSAPKFLNLDNSVTGMNNRRSLGVDDDFAVIERTLPNGGNFVLSAPVPATPADPLVITIQNNPSRPTPWGAPGGSAFKYVLKVSPKAS